MDEEVALLAELILQADIFCAAVETAIAGTPREQTQEIRLKISQCRGVLARLQGLYEQDMLTVKDRSTCADFRVLVMALLWIAFLARESVDIRLFRKLVQIESGFSHLLINQIGRSL